MCGFQVAECSTFVETLATFLRDAALDGSDSVATAAKVTNIQHPVTTTCPMTYHPS